MKVVHPFEPIYNSNSKILILGSMPSVKSREENFYYAHPQNRFWKVLAFIFNKDVPKSIEEKTQLVLENNLALWDSVKSCEIINSAYATIKNAVPNDIVGFVRKNKINKIIFNGKKSYDIFSKFFKEFKECELEVLPSTSPANAKFSFNDLCNIWKEKISN